MMTVILTNDALRSQFPETSIMVGTSSDKIGAIGREGTVPYPTLMTMESGFEREGGGGDGGH